MIDYNVEKGRFVIGGVGIVIVVRYVIGVFRVEIMREEYKKNGDSNGLVKEIEYGWRGGM